MKYKRKMCVLLVMAILAALPSTAVFAEDTSGTPFSVNAKAAVLMESKTGEILMEQNAHEKLSPASITKVMTLLLIYESVEQGRVSWDDVVTVSEHAAGMGGSQVFLEPFEKQTVRELTKCIAVASANDAAVAMAEHVSGNEPAFVAYMNDKAKALGMNNTNFENACGLDSDNHYSSAYDVAIMSRELTTKYPEVLELTQIWQDSITHKTARGEEIFELANTNKLLKWYSGATGLKTGSTSKALYCLSGTAERNGLSLIAVVLGAPDYKARFQETMNLLDYGFANFNIVNCEPAGTVKGEVQVYKGKSDTVNAVVKDTISVLVDKGDSTTIDNAVELIPSINAPFEAGVKVGEVIYTVDGQEVGRCDLVAEQAVEKIDLRGMILRLFNLWYQ